MRYLPSPNDEQSPDSSQTEEEEVLDEAELAEAYRNQHWTRLVSLQQQPLGEAIESRPLADAIISCLTEINGMEVAHEQEPIFDTAAFQEQHPEPSSDDFQLSEDQLKQSLALEKQFHEFFQNVKVVLRDQFADPAKRWGRGAGSTAEHDLWQVLASARQVIDERLRDNFDTGAAIPIYPSLAEGTSDRWARGEVRAHLDALRP